MMSSKGVTALVCLVALMWASAHAQNNCPTSALSRFNTLRAARGVPALEWDDFGQQDQANAIAAQIGCPFAEQSTSEYTEFVTTANCPSSDAVTCGFRRFPHVCAAMADRWYKKASDTFQYTETPLTSNQAIGTRALTQFAFAVWRSTERMGCARAAGRTASGGVCVAVVCRAWPPINLVDDETVLDNILPIDDGQSVLQPTKQPQSASQYDRVVSMADLHGDLDQAKSLLRTMNIIDGSDNWIGGKAMLVQTGDCVDRADRSLDLIRLFNNLKAGAAQAGGAVVTLLGNHEMMLLQGLSTEMEFSKDEIVSVGGLDALNALIAPRGEIGRLIRTMSVAHISRGVGNGCDILYIHGGARNWMIDQIQGTLPTGNDMPVALTNAWTAAVQSAIKDCVGANCWGTRGNLGGDLLAGNDNGAVWTRIYAKAASREAEVCAEVEAITRKMGVTRIVTGHNIQDGGKATVRCGGRLIIADIAMSKAYGRVKLGEGVAVQCQNGETTLNYGTGVGLPPRVEKLAPVSSSA